MATSQVDRPLTVNTRLPSADLASVACLAAAQLDSIIVGKSIEVDAIRQLADVISALICLNDVGTYTLRKPTTVIAMHNAISSSRLAALKENTLDEFLEEATKVRQDLIEVSDRPADMKQNNAHQLELMRDFCLAFSKTAASRQRVPGEGRSSHPYRR